MNRWQVLGPIAAIALVIAVLGIFHQQKGHERIVSARTRNIGQDLIALTNSPRLLGLPRGFSTQLSSLLVSPTRVSEVLLGDDSAPLGDGSACSRLILTNELGRGLQMRLGSTGDPEKFRILGYWPLDNPPRLR